MKYGNLNFLEPSGSLQTCNGTALPFFFMMLNYVAEYTVTSGVKQHSTYTFMITQWCDPEDDDTRVLQNITLFTQWHSRTSQKTWNLQEICRFLVSEDSACSLSYDNF